MSAETHAHVDTADVRQVLNELEEVKEQHKDVMRECLRKIEDGRIRDAQKEKARVKWVNSWVRVSKEYRQTLEAIETWQMADDLEQIKAQMDGE